MNRLNIAGILRTCAERVMLARDDKHIKEIIRSLKVDLKDEMEAPNE